MAGRPSVYSPEILAQTLDYIREYESHGDMIPSIAGLSAVLGFSRVTIHTWRNHDDKPEFNEAIEALLAKQERILINKGLVSEFNSVITKLALAKHGYHDKVDNTLGGGEKPLETKHTIEIIDGTSTDSEGV